MPPVLGCAASMTTEWKVAFTTIILHTHSWMLMQLYWEKSSFRSEATELTYTVHGVANTEKNRKEGGEFLKLGKIMFVSASFYENNTCSTGRINLSENLIFLTH